MKRRRVAPGDAFMTKSLGPRPLFFPLPVVLIATYDKDGKVDVMNMAWEGSFGLNTVSFNLNPIRKTLANIRYSRAFTLSVADVPHIKEVDYFGMVSGNTVEDKFERTGLKAERSRFVNAPALVDFPLTFECNVVSIDQEGNLVHIVGRIFNTLANERILDEYGNVDLAKIQGFYYNTFSSDYYSFGSRLGRSWSFGAELAKRSPPPPRQDTEQETQR